MKLNRKSLFKRLLLYSCCAILLFSSVFLCYENTVYASSGDSQEDLDAVYEKIIKDALIVAASSLGILLTGGGANAILSIVLSGVYVETDNLKDYVDTYIHGNEDGTTTISADFVNLVLQAYKQYRKENGEKFNGVMVPGSNGYYHYDSLSGIAYFNADIHQSAVYTDINTYYPCAVLVNSNKSRGSGYIINAPLIFYDKNDDLFYTTTDLNYGMPDDCKNNLNDFGQILEASLFVNKPNCAYNNSGNTGTEQSYPTGRIYLNAGWYESIAYCEVSSSSIPVYQSLSALKEGLRTGDFSEAYNYGKVPECETPAYTGTYDGGDITIPTEKLEGIQDKLDEIDKTDKDIYEKLKELLEWLIGNGGIGGGTDMTATNSWLEKIYIKVSQIFDKISETATGAVDTVNTKLQETLDEILSTLRTISGDVNDIKGQLETMSEQEFNEKSDSFLGEIMDAFSEISEVVKTKFPFSIPNDLRIFLSKIAPAQPDTEEQQIQSYSLDSSSGVVLYSGEHGGGGTSDGETNPPGGGGSSRPGSGFVDVDHGGSGGSRDPVEMREAPVFRLPIVIERYGIEEYIIIDMSPFDPLSRFSRSFFTIIFIICLFNLTFKVIGMWGDLVG